jgi:hypothetical protein
MTVLAVIALFAAAQAASPGAAASPPPPQAAHEAPPLGAPTEQDVLSLVRKAPAFAAATGRTDVRVNVSRSALIPGTYGTGHFVEVRWSDKGTPHTGLAVVAHTTVADPRLEWIVKDNPWGLVHVLEDKTLEAMLDEIKRAKIAANEAVAVGDTRTIITAEMLFMSLTNGSFGELRCLTRPSDCIEGIPTEQLLDPALTSSTEKNGYRRKFHMGARVASPKAIGKPSPFVKSFAYTAVPVAPGETGVRGFCGDSTGRVCVTADGSEPAVVGATCPTPCTELK